MTEPAAVPAGTAGVYAVLLRAINVGGRNRVAMADLRAAYRTAGCLDVRTLLQSGNVVVRTDEADPDRLRDGLRRALVDATGVEAPLLVRGAEEWGQLLAVDPWPGEGRDHVHVTFLDEPPTPSAAERALDRDIAPDRLAVIGRELWWYLPDGVRAGRLAGAPADRLMGAGTMRTWRTVERLAALLTEVSA